MLHEASRSPLGLELGKMSRGGSSPRRRSACIPRRTGGISWAALGPRDAGRDGGESGDCSAAGRVRALVSRRAGRRGVGLHAH